MLFLDQGHRPPLIRQCMRQRVAPLPRTDHDRVVFHRSPPPPSLDVLAPFVVRERNQLGQEVEVQGTGRSVVETFSDGRPVTERNFPPREAWAGFEKGAESRMRRILAVLAVARVVAVLAGADAGIAQDFQKTYPISPGGQVRISTVSGDVTVTGYDG